MINLPINHRWKYADINEFVIEHVSNRMVKAHNGSEWSATRYSDIIFLLHDICFRGSSCDSRLINKHLIEQNEPPLVENETNLLLKILTEYDVDAVFLDGDHSFNE